MPYSLPLNCFSAGTWSPTLIGRTDDDNYKNACLKLENMFIKSPSGGAVKRPGTWKIYTSDDIDNEVNLITFNKTSTCKFIIEAGNYYMRFYNSDGQITLSGTTYQITTPISSDIVSELKYIQRDDVMYFTHQSIPPQKLTRISDTEWTIEEIEFDWPPFLDQNKEEDKTVDITFNDSNVTLTASGLTFNDSNVTLTASGFSPFTEDSVGDYWKFYGTTTVSGRLSAEGSCTDYVELDYGKELQISMLGTWSGTVYIEKSKDATNFYQYTDYYAPDTTKIKESEYDIGYYRVKYQSYISGTVISTITLLDVAGYAKITSYLSPSTVYADIIEKLPKELQNYKWSQTAYNTVNKYPGAINICTQRLILAGSPKSPNTLFGSTVGEYENFDIGVLNDSDGFVFKLDSKRSDLILSMIDYRDSCHIFTDGNSYRLTGTNGNITPTSPDIYTDIFIESNNVQCVGAGSCIVFSEMYGKKLNHKYYDGDQETYVAKDISSHAENLFIDTTIKDIAYARSPNNQLIVTKADGKLAICCYDVSRSLTAWSEYTTEGIIESAAILPGENEHEIWLSVIRNNKRCIEKMSSSVWTNLEDSNYLDSAVTYSGTPVNYLQGLDHLEGLTVGATCSGAYIKSYTVSEGMITLENSYPQITAGQLYDAVLETMPIQVPGNMGNSIGKNKKISAVSIGLYKSFTCDVGYDEDNLDTIPDIESGNYVFGSAPTLLTKNARIIFNGDIDEEVSIYIKSSTPTPLHISYLIPEITVW